MGSVRQQPMYEAGVLGPAAGGMLRPGGLELTGRMLALCALPPNAFLLDVGCGSGQTVKYLHTLGFTRAFGIDRSRQVINAGTSLHPNRPLACASGSALPAGSGQVDGILAECSLSAMADLDGSLTEFQRVLRPGGVLALSDVYARSPAGLPALRSLPISCGLADTTTRAELMEHLQNHGFDILIWEDHSELLKELSTRITLTHGSLGEFWRQSEPAVNPLDMQIAIHKAKLGYYFLIARKV